MSRPSCPAATPLRIVALDGIRGVLALMVMVSHYFGEVPNGWRATLFGWVAVKMFFVLSGFLMARIMLQHMESPNFLATFYVRRLCRTLPVYLFTLVFVFGSIALLGHRSWIDADQFFPLWRYLTFTQTFEMLGRGSYGTEWLTPTWTLTVEEQFYLLAPLALLALGRRYLLSALVAGVGLSLGFRCLSHGWGMLPTMAGHVLLPAVVHAMLLGMIATVLLSSARVAWARYDHALRIMPIGALWAAIVLKLVEGPGGWLFELVGVPLVSFGCAAYLLSIVRGAPEARRMEAPPLRFFGRLSFGIYLLHMPVLGLLHGLVLHAKPDLATPAQLAVTLAAVGITIVIAWLVHHAIEQPMIEFGRRWTFRAPGTEGAVHAAGQGLAGSRQVAAG